jgi:cytochrome c oxidase assembly factor CtaG
MIQHELLMLVAAPLVASAGSLVAFLWVMPAAVRRRLMLAIRRGGAASGWAVITAAPTVWVLHGLALWVWHVPALFEAALRSELVHVAQHLSFFLSATLFWWGLAHGRYGRLGYGAAVVYVFATAVHSGVLGALLTFSPHVWYRTYAHGPAMSGLTPLEDQQIAGLVMWVPASAIFLGGALVFFAAWLRESERATQRTRGALGPHTAGVILCAVAAASTMMAASACDRESYLAAAQLTGGDPGRGKAAARKYGCGSCHQIPGLGESARSHVGPPLTSIAARTYLAGHVANTPAAMEEWIRHPREVDDRTAMPDSGVSIDDARDIAAYLYTLR